jgi:Ca-activated chloride channel family protein
MILKPIIRALFIPIVLIALTTGTILQNPIAAAQSGRQPPQKKVEKKTEAQKATKQTDKKEEQQEEMIPPEIRRQSQNEPPLKLATQVVNVEVTVVDKKTHRLVSNLTKKNFTIYEDGVKQEITNFAPAEGPVTAVLLLDNGFQNRYWRGYTNPTTAQEIFQAAAGFLQSFVKPQDYIAIVTFSMKPKVIQDFTNDRQRLYEALMAAWRDLLNFSESNIFDALSFVLLGGKAIQLYEEEAGPSQYIGLQEIEGHTAVILITTGIDTFSRITFDKALKIVSQAGVPIYTISVGNLFYKKYEQYFSPEDRLTYLQAQNQLRAFAERSGGAFFEMTFEGEIPSIMHTIEALLRNQYSLGYTPTNTRRAGRERKIKVEVDIDGDGKPDNDRLELHYRQRYIEPDDNEKKGSKKQAL